MHKVLGIYLMQILSTKQDEANNQEVNNEIKLIIVILDISQMKKARAAKDKTLWYISTNLK